MAHSFLKLRILIALSFACVGIFFGTVFFNFSPSKVIGGLSGLMTGYLYGHYVFRIRSARIVLGTLYGILAGIVSGAVTASFFGVSSLGYMAICGIIGGIIGAIPGLLLGICCSIIIAYVRKRFEPSGNKTSFSKTENLFAIIAGMALFSMPLLFYLEHLNTMLVPSYTKYQIEKATRLLQSYDPNPAIPSLERIENLENYDAAISPVLVDYLFGRNAFKVVKYKLSDDFILGLLAKKGTITAVEDLKEYVTDKSSKESLLALRAILDIHNTEENKEFFVTTVNQWIKDAVLTKIINIENHYFGFFAYLNAGITHYTSIPKFKRLDDNTIYELLTDIHLEKFDENCDIFCDLASACDQVSIKVLQYYQNKELTQLAVLSAIKQTLLKKESQLREDQMRYEQYQKEKSKNWFAISPFPLDDQVFLNKQIEILRNTFSGDFKLLPEKEKPCPCNERYSGWGD